jgi:maleylacetoacetate isomerase
MELFGYFRSSASYRVRIALNLKGLDYLQIPVHLIKNGGEQFSASFQAINPESIIPVLREKNDGEMAVLSQSLAIMEYLEEKYPEPALLPDRLVDRAFVRALSLSIACDIHPVNNLRILKYLSAELGVTEEQKNTWYRHWCTVGLTAMEQRLSQDVRCGDFCFGDAPTMADCCLIPQIFNAQRFNCDLSEMPTLMRINQHCLKLDAFTHASPANQADAE